MISFAAHRQRMVQIQLAARGVRSEAVLRAMGEVPRERFVPEQYQRAAYDDMPLPIEAGQTISQPFIVAAMIEAAEIKTTDRVLEIGAGSGYAAAVMSRIASSVIAIERHRELADTAAARLRELRYDNIEIRCADGTKGWPEAAPYDAIVASAGAPAIPQALKEQLDIGGRLVIPVGSPTEGQRLVKLTRESATALTEEDLGGVAFVPLIGVQGWREDDDGRFYRTH
jgi:protein-L-isoaspartate(D-aspartate) O-methyltransferase